MNTFTKAALLESWNSHCDLNVDTFYPQLATKYSIHITDVEGMAIDMQESVIEAIEADQENNQDYINPAHCSSMLEGLTDEALGLIHK